MRTETTTKTWYKFDELSDEAKEYAVRDFYDINVSHEWWESIYDDAKNVGIKIMGFDIDRGNYIETRLIYDIDFTVHSILKSHGEETDIYKLAKQYDTDKTQLLEKYAAEIAEEDFYDFDNDLDDQDAEFTRAIGEEYLSLLRQEYEYLTSTEAIIETIQANDYEFDENGNR